MNPIIRPDLTNTHPVVQIGPFPQWSEPGRIVSLGGAVTDVVRTRMFITRTDVATEVSEAHGEIFGDVRPAATMVVVSALLDPRWLVEVEVDAILNA